MGYDMSQDAPKAAAKIKGCIPRPCYLPLGPKYPEGHSPGAEAEGSTVAKAVFSVVGIKYPAFAASVEKNIKRLPGIKDAALSDSKACVHYDPEFVSVSPVSLLFTSRATFGQNFPYSHVVWG